MGRLPIPSATVALARVWFHAQPRSAEIQAEASRGEEAQEWMSTRLRLAWQHTHHRAKGDKTTALSLPSTVTVLASTI